MGAGLEEFAPVSSTYKPLEAVCRNPLRRQRLRMNPEPNHPAAGNAALTFRLTIGRHGRGVPEPARLPMRREEEVHGQTLRMSLALTAAGRCTVAQQRARDAGHRPVPPTRSGQDDLLRLPRVTIKPANKADGAARPGHLIAVGRPGRPAAHPQRWAEER